MKTIQTDFSDLQLYVGLDVHKKQWSVSVYTTSAHHRTFTQPPTPQALKSYLDHNFPRAKVVCAYESSKFGYWIYRELTSYGYQCLVVNPADIPTSDADSDHPRLIAIIFSPSTFVSTSSLLGDWQQKNVTIGISIMCLIAVLFMFLLPFYPYSLTKLS